MSSLTEKKQGKGYLLTFCLCAATAFFIFLPFLIVDKGLFQYCGDFNSQQIPFYTYMNDFVKHSAGQWSWETDLGSSAVNSYSFYLLGSPFFWLTTLLPKALVPFSMVPMFMIKFGVAGLGAFCYLRRYAKTRNFAVVASCLYALSGFTVYNTFFNHFVDCIALFPFLLWALDAYVYDHQRGVFPLVVAVNLINNYFFFVGEIVFLFLYFICKILSGEYRIKLRRFVVLTFESLLGVAMGCLLLIPAILCLKDNPRTVDLSSGFGFLMYYRVQQYFAIFTSLFLPPDPTYLPSIYTEGVIKHTSLTAWLPVVSCAGVLAYVRARKKSATTKVLWVCFFMAFVPVLNSAFYALNSSYYARWFYMPILLMCAATMQALESDDIDVVGGIKTVAIITAAFAVFGLVPKKVEEAWSFGVANNPAQFWLSYGIALAGLLLFYLVLRMAKSKVKLAPMLLAAVLGFSVFYSVIHISLGKFPQWDGDAEYRSQDYDAAQNIDWGEDFYRIDSYKCYDNISMWTQKSCLQFFNSVVTPSIMEFYPQFGVKRDVSSKPEPVLYALRGLLSTRYTITPNKEADAFSTENNQYGWTFDHKDETFTYFKNENELPMGFAYDEYISMTDFATIAEASRANLLVRAIGLSDEQIALYGQNMTRVFDTADFSYAAYQQDIAHRRTQASTAFTADGSGFTANITLAKDNLVFFSVPYDSGFTATVNGVETKVEKVSGGMSAVLGRAGENEIIFTYHTPGLRLSGYITAGGILVWGCYCALLWRRKKMRTEKQK
ncbi:MAG: YfhO family protein [Ruthenibacterium sp.]